MRSKLRLIFILCAIALIYFPALSGQELPTTEPHKVGLCTDRLERIDVLMQDLIDRSQIAGSIGMVARKGKVAYFKNFGQMEIEAKKPMTKDTIFRIASMSKPITSVAVMILFEEGRFLLNDPVGKYIPQFNKKFNVYTGEKDGKPQYEPQARPITIRHLLTHTSGLTYGFFGDTAVDKMYRKAGMWTSDLAGMVKKLAELPLLFHPGTKWNYSVSTDVLGYLVEVVSGLSLDKFFAQRILKPLGMDDTGFYVSQDKLVRFSASYRPNQDKSALELADSPQTGRFSKGLPRLCSGGGGLVSTASDYMRFCMMLLNGGELDKIRILGRKTVEFMTLNHIGEIGLYNSNATGSKFGLGFAIHVDPGRSGSLGSAGEYSWGGIYNTSFFIDPHEKLIGIMMSQLNPNNHLRLGAKFKAHVYQAIVD